MIVKYFIFETVMLTLTWSDCQFPVHVNGQVGQAKIKIKTSILKKTLGLENHFYSLIFIIKVPKSRSFFI